MSTASKIAGLIQVGKAKGYSDLTAVYYAHNNLHPDVKFTATAIKGIGAEIHKRLRYLSGSVWGVLVLLVMQDRIIPESESSAGAALPGWAWGLIGFMGIMALTGGRR